MTTVLLATSHDLPEGEPGGSLLIDAFAAAGAEASWAVWDDPSVDWTAVDRVVVRSTWDYESRLGEFLSWARQVPSLLNGVDVFAWNTHKGYLLDLVAAGLPVVPTELVEGEEDLPSALAAAEQSVVKPVVGAGGRGLVVFDGRDGGVPGLDEAGLGPGPWIVQPLVESVRTEGERSVFVLGGRAVSQAVKTTGGGEEVRVHPRYGGATRGVPLEPAAVSLAERTVAAAEEHLGVPLAYARVDLLRYDGDLVVGELEVTEPGLYLDVLPANADALARAALAAQ
ncbi:ATP-grasp domain-containing protein [Marmoricola endophyticus]|uniref:ATP-grasp domain-containing protein n=1 Tax=Marmoricola endophyticus TaxID=2040280 RepID=A0A917F553_9ACTN|nr:hypothetical protein [Marmoricola endophyticus]GGF53319.1 ATP-grasp domain-containing protein [Marmoricola endophyticus]